MSKEAKTEEKSSDGLSAKVRHLEEEVTYLKSKMQRISDNWKAYAKKFLGSSAIDGKLGFAKLGWLVMVAFLSLVVTAAMAETSTWYPFDTNEYGVVSITGNSSTKQTAITATSISFTGTVNGSSITNINAANLAANTTASAINGASITNMNGANLLSGNIALARVTNVLITTGANTTLAAFNGSAITNMNGANLLSGNVALARVTNVLVTTGAGTTLAAFDGQSVTNMNGAQLLSGNIALDRVTNVLVTTGAGTTLAAFDGQSVTNLNGSSILSGSIPVARVTNAFVSGLYAITAGSLSTTGTVTLADGSVASVDLAGKTELAASVSCSIATNANGGTNVCTFTVKDLAGTAMADQCAFRFFITDAISAAPSAVAGDVVISGGIELQEVVNKADYWVFSTLSNGTAIATITDTPGSTNYVHAVAPGGKISRAQSQFNVP